MTSNAYAVTPAIDRPSSVSFKHRGSGNNKTLELYKSTDNGTNWEKIGEVKTSSASAYGSGSCTIGENATSSVLIKFVALSGTIYIDDVTITASTMAEQPTTQAQAAVANIAGATLDVNLTAGNGEGRLLAYWADGTTAWSPADGEAYVAPFPKEAAAGVWVASSGTETSVSISNLSPNTLYHFAVFEYNGTGTDRNYLTPAYTTGATTLAVPTITPSSSLLNFQNVKVGNTRVATLKIAAAYLKANTLSIQSTEAAFKISATKSDFASSVTLPVSNGTLEQTTLYVQFAPADYKTYSAHLTLTAETATTQITLNGVGADTENYTYYIAPTGNDETGDGTMDNPWYNLQKAVNAAVAGDVIICRGGRYSPTMTDSSGKTTIRLKHSGRADAMITIRNAEGEEPVFDFAATQLIADGSMVGTRGFEITGNYWYLYGLHITHAGDNGIKVEGSYNRIERCELSYNFDSGIQLGFGHNFSDSGFGSANDGTYCAYNDIVDCDSHHNCDNDANYGSDADGFACKMHNGKGNRFIRCRAWRNSDDAWDLYETDFDVVLIECWAWESGNADDHLWAKDFVPTSHGFSGNGNGIKLGGNGTGGSSKGVHYAINCIAFGCDKSGSTKGFDCNSHKGGHVIVGGLAFDNGYDFMFESGGGANSEFYNNVCFGKQEILVGTESHNAYLGSAEQGQTFYNNLVTDFSRADYVSLLESDAIAPRADDGSMPARFGRLKSSSALVNAGIDKPIADNHIADFPFLYQPIYGTGRDLGPYELKEGDIHTDVQMILTHEKTTSLTLLQGSYAKEVIAKLSTSVSQVAQISILSLSGQVMATVTKALEAGADYYLPLPTQSLQAGVYLCRLQVGDESMTEKMLIGQ